MNNFDSLNRLNFGDDDDDNDKKKLIFIIVGIVVLITAIVLLVIFLAPKNNKKDDPNKVNTQENGNKKNDDDDDDGNEGENTDDDQLEIVLDGLDDIVVVDDDDDGNSTENNNPNNNPNNNNPNGNNDPNNNPNNNNNNNPNNEQPNGDGSQSTNVEKTYVFSYPTQYMDVVIENGALKASYKDSDAYFYLETYLSNTMDDVVANIDILKKGTIKKYDGLILDDNYSYKEFGNKMWYISNGRYANYNFSSGYVKFKEGVALASIFSKEMEIKGIYEDISVILNSAKVKE